MEHLKCLGCEGPADYFFFVHVFRLSGGPGSKTRTLGVCEICSTPGSPTYQAFRQAFGALLFMQKNVLPLPSASVDSKTAAAGGDL